MVAQIHKGMTGEKTSKRETNNNMTSSHRGLYRRTNSCLLMAAATSSKNIYDCSSIFLLYLWEQSLEDTKK